MLVNYSYTANESSYHYISPIDIGPLVADHSSVGSPFKMGPGRQRRRNRTTSSPWALRALGVLSWDLRCRGEGTGAMAGPENLAGEVSIVS